MYLLRTIDVWDTLLRRDCHPEVIKQIVARHVCLRHGAEISGRRKDPRAAYEARLAVERMLARRAQAAGKDGEYAIREVVECWLRELAPGHDLSAAVQPIIDYEFAVENAHAFPDADIRATLDRYPPAKTLFVSDFYWPGEMVLELLRAKGLDSVVSEGVTSCDVGTNKRSGGRYRHVLDRYGVSPEQVLHIGDNHASDVVVARSLGIHAVHYAPPQGHRERLENERRFARRGAVCEQAAAEAAVEARPATTWPEDTAAEAFAAGVDAAPIFIGFAMHVAEHAISRRLQRLYFLTREGVFLQRVHRAMFPGAECGGLALPEASLLSVSRASTQPAALERPTVDVLDRGRWPHRGHTVGALIAAMGLEREDVAAACSRCGLTVEDVIAHPSEDERVRRLLRDETLVHAAEASAARRQGDLLEYLRGQGVDRDGRYGVVDVGWRGTIQDNLAAILPQAEFHGSYLALREQLTVRLPNVSKSAYVFVEGEQWHTGRLLETYALVEMLCTSSAGTVRGYAASAGGMSPVSDPVNDECPCFDAVVAPFQDGVIAACDAWRRHLERNGFGSRELHASAVDAWRRLSRTPSRAIVGAFLATRLHDPYAVPPALLPSEMPDWPLLSRAAIDGTARRRVRDYVRRVQWRHAVRAANDRSPVLGRVLGGLCAAGTWYRQFRVCRRRFGRALATDAAESMRR